jgi:hypothetical protein
MVLAAYLGTHGVIASGTLVTYLVEAFPSFIPYFNAEINDKRIFHAHCPEIYLAWMQALEETDVLG